MGKRIITTENLEEDIKIEGELRPHLLTEYIGQEKAKATLKVYIAKGSVGSCAFLRTARPGEDDTRGHYCQ